MEGEHGKSKEGKQHEGISALRATAFVVAFLGCGHSTPPTRVPHS